MTTENSGSVMVTAVMQEQSQSFLTDEVQLKKLSRRLSKISDEVIDALLELMKSKDEKVRMAVAFKLLEYDIDVKKAISQDQMQRLIAEVKYIRQNNTKQLEAQQGNGGKPKPIVDFSTVRNV